ncbi:TetR family transcriptional regulator [Mycobacterium sp. HNNTM2301]|uniref:TetR family transcriptional regulator n=1 Tax=Mycobacterium hainanense TaxID=3289775 RepID=UPI0035A72A40
MPRWQQGSKERLQQAAMELFEEQGFDNTSAVQIAARARVTTRTFFRYFSDKQEVLFVDADSIHATLVERLLETEDLTEPLLAVTQVLAEFDWESLGSRETIRRREAMIASTPGLLERELIKQQRLADGLNQALQQREVDPGTAELVTRVGVDVFRVAYKRWLADNAADLSAVTQTVMSMLAAVAPARAMPTRRVRASSKTRRNEGNTSAKVASS